MNDHLNDLGRDFGSQLLTSILFPVLFLGGLLYIVIRVTFRDRNPRGKHHRPESPSRVRALAGRAGGWLRAYVSTHLGRGPAESGGLDIVRPAPTAHVPTAGEADPEEPGGEDTDDADPVRPDPLTDPIPVPAVAPVDGWKLLGHERPDWDRTSTGGWPAGAWSTTPTIPTPVVIDAEEPEYAEAGVS